MNSIVIFATIFCLAAFAGVHASAVNKDVVLGFGLMISKVTGRNPLDFCGYGKWCGAGGSGTPVDAIDNCCKIHDECYDRTAEKYSICVPHLAMYIFSYDKNKNDVKCSALTNCGSDTCECDRQAVLCFKANEAAYNPANKGDFWGQLSDCVSSGK